jgi:hypothetical protein
MPMSIPWANGPLGRHCPLWIGRRVPPEIKNEVAHDYEVGVQLIVVRAGHHTFFKFRVVLKIVSFIS